MRFFIKNSREGASYDTKMYCWIYKKHFRTAYNREEARKERMPFLRKMSNPQCKIADSYIYKYERQKKIRNFDEQS